MTHRDALITKIYILAIKKSIYNIEIFSSQNYMRKKFFKFGYHNWLKMQNMTQRDARSRQTIY